MMSGFETGSLKPLPTEADVGFDVSGSKISNRLNF